MGYQFKGSFSDEGIKKGTIKGVKGDLFKVEWGSENKINKLFIYLEDGEIIELFNEQIVIL